ncbi:putative effector protein [Ceratobasidium theobromae]|uniref:Putative effector protein n=1 Tax=Ceratobasidium theobromae TaxID=1582974 RepID=A0A5N5QB85_9AGAM|nr:putative effector protein [Ceratobasidium theobromae]
MHFTTLLTFFGASLAASGVQAAKYASTCTATGLNGDNLMFASCQDATGLEARKKTTVLDLNGCIVNRNGRLSCQANGRYDATCNGCFVSDTTMTCSCEGRVSTITTSINLDDCVSNLDGVLSCP